MNEPCKVCPIERCSRVPGGPPSLAELEADVRAAASSQNAGARWVRLACGSGPRRNPIARALMDFEGLLNNYYQTTYFNDSTF